MKGPSSGYTKGTKNLGRVDIEGDPLLLQSRFQWTSHQGGDMADTGGSAGRSKSQI
jgi:hypothetical protein